MKLSLVCVLSLLFFGCGQQNSNTVSPVPNPIPQFQAYQMNSQDLPANVLTQIQASTLYIGNYNQYNSNTSTWTPGITGLYFVDDQETILGTYTESTVTFMIELYLNGEPQLLKTYTINVTPGVPTQTSLEINSLMPFDNNSSTQAWVYVSSGVNTIVSAWSQFEGYYVGQSTSILPLQL